MTQDEFQRFTKRLFAYYPSLHGWLKNNSPDAGETLRHWFRVLEPFALSDCLQVLTDWEQTTDDPFGFNSRDKAAHLIRSSVVRSQEKRRAKERQAKIAAEYKRKKNSPTAAEDEVPLTEHFDSEMVAAVKEGIPHHKRFLAGEIDWAEYWRIKDEIIAKHLGGEYAAGHHSSPGTEWNG